MVSAPDSGYLNQSSHLTLASIGSISHRSYNGHLLAHKVLGYRHSSLTGLKFTKPGSHLHDRLARLRGHHWHKPFRHVVIDGFAGAAACDLDCEFDVPEGVYGDFIAAAGAEGTGDFDASAEEDAESARPGTANGYGWNKAVAILESLQERTIREPLRRRETPAGPEVFSTSPKNGSMSA